MIKIIGWITRILFWLQAFAGPVLVFGFLAFVMYNHSDQNKGIAIAVLVTGATAGILLAEWIRRKYGLETFFGRIYGPNEMDQQDKEK